MQVESPAQHFERPASTVSRAGGLEIAREFVTSDDNRPARSRTRTRSTVAPLLFLLLIIPA